MYGAIYTIKNPILSKLESSTICRLNFDFINAFDKQTMTDIRG